MSMPQNLKGYIDDAAVLTLDGFTSAVDYILEHVPALFHPESVRVYGSMRHDPMVAAILQAYGAPIERAHWSIDPAGARDEVVQRVADDLGLPIDGVDAKPTGARRRRFTWAEHLPLAGLNRVFGHMFFEQAWALEGGSWRLDVVQERMPQTIAALKLNPDGTLAGVAQGSIVGRDLPVITTADHRLVYYTRQREGSNYFGQSLIRACYAPWLIKTQVMRVWPTSNRRNGMGVWKVTAPAGATPQQIAEAQRIAGSTRAGENVGMGLPAGFTAELTGMSGSLPNHKELADFCNQEMARSTLTMLLTMVGAERGARSLGETVMDLMILAQQADAEAIAKAGTDQIVVPLVDANWGEDETAPRIKVGNVGADVETTAQDIYWLLAYGGVKPDTPFRSWVRELRGMPPEDPTDPVFQTAAPNPSQPDPNAPPEPTTGA